MKIIDDTNLLIKGTTNILNTEKVIEFLKLNQFLEIKSIDWYNNNKDVFGNVSVPCAFTEKMCFLCSKKIQIDLKKTLLSYKRNKNARISIFHKEEIGFIFSLEMFKLPNINENINFYEFG